MKEVPLIISLSPTKNNQFIASYDEKDELVCSYCKTSLLNERVQACPCNSKMWHFKCLTGTYEYGKVTKEFRAGGIMSIVPFDHCGHKHATHGDMQVVSFEKSRPPVLVGVGVVAIQALFFLWCLEWGLRKGRNFYKLILPWLSLLKFLPLNTTYKIKVLED